MTPEFFKAVSNLEQLNQSHRSKIKDWSEAPGYAGTISVIKGFLKDFTSKSSNAFIVYENELHENVKEIGIKVNQEETFYVLDVENKTIATKKIPATLRIRLDYKRNIEFVGISPFFDEKDGLKKIIVLHSPIDPHDFSPAILLEVVIAFLKFAYDWELNSKPELKSDN